MTTRACALVLCGGDTVAAGNVINSQLVAAKIDVSLIELEKLHLPLYLEQPSKVPGPVSQWRQALKSHTGIFFVTSEVAGSVAPVLVNALAWADADRQAQGDKNSLLHHTIVGLTATTTNSRSMGIRALGQLASTLGTLGAVVLPFPVGIGPAQMSGPHAVGSATAKQMETLVKAFVDALQRAAGPDPLSS